MLEDSPCCGGAPRTRRVVRGEPALRTEPAPVQQRGRARIAVVSEQRGGRGGLH